MKYTKEVIEKNGGKVEWFIEDPQGGHQSYHLTPEYHEIALQIFIELTSSISQKKGINYGNDLRNGTLF